MALNAQFAATPRIAGATVSAANPATGTLTGRDGTGTVPTILTAGSLGTRINRIEVRSLVTTTAGMVRIFLHDGTNAYLWSEVAVSAITPSATVAAFSATLSEAFNKDILPFVLPTGWSVRASTEKAENFRVIVHGADL